MYVSRIATSFANLVDQASESQVANLTSDLAAKAPLNSPVFTGTPSAPTAPAGTNTTQLATTAFVASAVASGGATIGAAVGGGTASDLLFVDSSGKLGQDGSLTFTDVTNNPALTIGNGTGSPQVFFNYAASAGGDLTGKMAGVQQLSFGFNNSGQFGGTASTTSGRTIYFYDRVASVFLGGISGNDGSFNWGPSSNLKIRSDGSLGLATVADASASNDSLYYSSTLSALAYKDPAGTVHNLQAAGGGGGGGTVTSVGLALPASVFSVSGSPVTTSGTLTGAFATQSANLVFAGPATGVAATPTFRSLVSADIPASVALAGTPTAPTPITADNSTAIATTAFVKAQGYITSNAVTSVFGRTGAVVAASGDYSVSQVTGAAPLASPALTGTPSAPTPATSDNSTTIATTAFVKAQGYLTSNAVTSVFGRTGAVVPASGDYSVSQVTGAAPLASPAMTGTPTAPTPATSDNSTGLATTAYVQNNLQAVQVKPTAQAATTAALPANTYANGTSGVGATLTATANGALTVDGYAVQTGDRVLVKNEATGTHNGFYKVTNPGGTTSAYVLTRDTAMDAASKYAGAVVPVGPSGSANSNTFWICTNTAAPTVGTTAITFGRLALPKIGQPVLGGTANYALYVDGSGNLADTGIYMSAAQFGIGGTPSYQTPLYAKMAAGGGGYGLELHCPDSNPYTAGFFNDTYSTTTPVFMYFAYNDGSFILGSPGPTDVWIATNGYNVGRLVVGGTASNQGRVGIGVAFPAGNNATINAQLHVVSTDPALSCGIDQATLGMRVPLRQWQDSGGNLLSSVTSAGAFSGPRVPPLKTVTAAYMATAADEVILANASAAAFTITLPSAATPSIVYIIKKTDSSSNAVTIATSPNTQLIDGAATKVLSTQYSSIRLISDGSNWNVI